VGAVPTYTFSNVTTNHTINASFAIRTFTINATAGSGGSISPTGTVTVNYGNNSLFTITPTPPYLIADVVVNGTSVGKVSSYTFMNVTTNHTINASFSLLPVANFTGTPTGGVLPLSVQFTDTSTNSPTSWAWIFGDGGTSTLQNPLHQYTSFGNYTVNLTVTNAVGSNTTSKTKYIPVCWGDNFDDNSLGSAWTTVGGTWSESGQVLSQTSTATADPKKAIISNSGQTFGTSHTITAKVRINSWVNGDMARGGVSVFSNTADGSGYNLLFHNDLNTVQFLNDKVAWGPVNSFSWSTGTWYWFKLKIESGILSGKVWQDGGPEPPNWQWTYTPAARTGTVYPALNGGSSDGTVYSTDSFDDVMVCPL
jgi:PKD repeat protein